MEPLDKRARPNVGRHGPPEAVGTKQGTHALAEPRVSPTSSDTPNSPTGRTTALKPQGEGATKSKRPGKTARKTIHSPQGKGVNTVLSSHQTQLWGEPQREKIFNPGEQGRSANSSPSAGTHNIGAGGEDALLAHSVVSRRRPKRCPQPDRLEVYGPRGKQHAPHTNPGTSHDRIHSSTLSRGRHQTRDTQTQTKKRPSSQTRREHSNTTSYRRANNEVRPRNIRRPGARWQTHERDCDTGGKPHEGKSLTERQTRHSYFSPLRDNHIWRKRRRRLNTPLCAREEPPGAHNKGSSWTPTPKPIFRATTTSTERRPRRTRRSEEKWRRASITHHKNQGG